MSEQTLDSKTALITGSTSGIGLAIATALAKAGAQIVLHGLVDQQRAGELLAQMAAAGAKTSQYLDADLRDVSAVDRMMSQLEEGGGVDILVNNAGVQITTPLAEATPDIWDHVLAVNLSAAFHTMRHALPKMAQKGYGRVINIASVHGLVASINKAPYVASKFGLNGLSKAAALEYAEAGTRAQGGVTVNTICPGWTQTALIEPQIQDRAKSHDGDREAGIADLLSEKQPSRRLSDASEIGAMVLFLCSPLAHNITGSALSIDGGWSAQ